MPPSNPTANHSVTGQDTHTLIVLQGRQAGARANITPNSVVTVGTGLENDVVLYSHGANQYQLTITGTLDSVEIVVVEGVVLRNGEPLGNGVIYEVGDNEQFAMADSVFTFEFAEEEIYADASDPNDLAVGGDQTTGSAKAKAKAKAEEASSNRSLTYLYIAGGLILLTSVVTTGLVRAFQNEDNRKKTFYEEISAAGYENLNVIPPQGDLPARVSGAVFSVEDRSDILALAVETGTSVELDLQINEELIGVVEDVYRVNGITADVSVSGIGEVEVWTSTKNSELLNSIEASIKNDIPDVISLTSTNSMPAEMVVEISPVAAIDPDKQVTLVVAGVDGYLMTRDKSRYFIGSMLPSGHIIQKIENGNVYVLAEDGKELVLEFN